MNPELINARVKELNAIEDQARKILSDAERVAQEQRNNLIAIEGAKQDCNYWLERLAKDVGLPITDTQIKNMPELNTGIAKASTSSAEVVELNKEVKPKQQRRKKNG